MNERWPGLPPVYKKAGECWTRELNISDHPPVNMTNSPKLFSWWTPLYKMLCGMWVDHVKYWVYADAIYGHPWIQQWRRMLSLGEHQRLVNQYIYIYISFCWLFMIHFCFHTFSNLYCDAWYKLHLCKMGKEEMYQAQNLTHLNRNVVKVQSYATYLVTLEFEKWSSWFKLDCLGCPNNWKVIGKTQLCYFELWFRGVHFELYG